MSVLIYLDSDLLVVNKRAGEAVETRKRGVETIISHWRSVLEDAELQPVHRIDQPVSGLVVVSRHRDSAAALHRQFHDGEVRREYVAVVTTAPPESSGTIEDRIATDSSRNRSNVDQTGKAAQLHYEVIGATTHHTVLLIRLETGRHHQIRVQLAHRGWHVLGDAKYGARRPLRDKSIALLAWRIRFSHPRTGQEMAFQAEPPEGTMWASVSETLREIVTPREGAHR
ncbi:MAG: RluA family pseudouridine synthase [Spirochaeta sp.]|nr:RluA family pseudouridine synthase [Spirochaeta sp.]